MRNARLLAALTTALVLAAGSAWADPGNGQGNGKKFSQGFQGQDDQGGHGKGRKSAHGDRAQGPSIDRNGVLVVLGGYRDYWSPGPALPPGIRKNLARGKPLPPGIARKLDGRLLGQLPRYDGYEWQQAGADLILVSIASGIIYEVLSGAFN
ncbi:putative integral membrane protein [Pseudomonas asplenii]|uniref:Putative integral membrane protein n=1 Tax=Pseudomonas asplenii TaxID=53407 RepID=A0A0M9GIW0_9PSED|nr:anti-virulence regulator CigR family protein [Pseudomonas fuscovaginae]KPA92068.1 putative integral membrane protein [Pseudomonas fuscovaginae]